MLPNAPAACDWLRPAGAKNGRDHIARVVYCAHFALSVPSRWSIRGPRLKLIHGSLGPHESAVRQWHLDWLSRFVLRAQSCDRNRDRPRHTVCSNSPHLHPEAEKMNQYSFVCIFF